MDQMVSLFEHYQKRESERIRVYAAIHGAKLKENKNIDKEPSDDFEFVDPDSYKSLSKEKRKELTDRMKKKHMFWAGTTTNALGKGTK